MKNQKESLFGKLFSSKEKKDCCSVAIEEITDTSREKQLAINENEAVVKESKPKETGCCGD